MTFASQVRHAYYGELMHNNYALHAVTTPVELDEASEGFLEEGQQVRLEYAVPEEGTVLTLEARQGKLELFASMQTTSPNEAFHEWRAETSSSTDVIIRPDQIESRAGNSRRRRNVVAESQNTTTVPVYVAIFGREADNSFSLESGELLSCGLMCCAYVAYNVYV